MVAAHHLSSPGHVEVAAGLVFHQGRLLITRRPAGTHLGGLWEFPGGKREPHETFEACLQRELREELGIEVEVGPLWCTVQHEYPEVRVQIHFYLCRWRAGEPRALGCAAWKWVDRRTLRRHRFPAADAQLLEQLVQTRKVWESAG
ncbi:8-oxo-dGTP diphosphatase MutT [Limisphaera ngatamarikiensis]|uniref:8-oxo-dGTP diphosphatase n=1 Tax=Limisphaera ngatamarikiensis TaxID=1324935 RepID=A0A6M1S2Z9_9BACT|nr:8-oxo-dGTP diphosphatase MutT [Limisphaera ngatamarikiensis]NGO39690.1 8-oxo-dGTP diphosphatase MutT [Limisphaera ngatamarikiensis]